MKSSSSAETIAMPTCATEAEGWQDRQWIVIMTAI
jgi:hypothetical protein